MEVSHPIPAPTLNRHFFAVAAAWLALGGVFPAWIAQDWRLIAPVWLLLACGWFWLNRLDNDGAFLQRLEAESMQGDDAELVRLVLDELVIRAGVDVTPTLWRLPTMGYQVFACRENGQGAIALSEGVVSALTLPELTAVLAHELAHLVRNDVDAMYRSGLLLWLANVGFWVGSLLLLVAWVLMLFSLLSLPLLPLILWPCWYLAFRFLVRWPAHRREHAADEMAADLCGDAPSLLGALQKLDIALSDEGSARARRAGRRFGHPHIERRISLILQSGKEIATQEIFAPLPRPEDQIEVILASRANATPD